MHIPDKDTERHTWHVGCSVSPTTGAVEGARPLVGVCVEKSVGVGNINGGSVYAGLVMSSRFASVPSWTGAYRMSSSIGPSFMGCPGTGMSCSPGDAGGMEASLS